MYPTCSFLPALVDVEPALVDVGCGCSQEPGKGEAVHLDPSLGSDPDLKRQPRPNNSHSSMCFPFSLEKDTSDGVTDEVDVIENVCSIICIRTNSKS